MKTFSIATSVLVAGAISISATAQQDEDASASKLVLQISNMRNQIGQICISIFSDENGFPTEGNKAIYSKCLANVETTGSKDVEIALLPPGNYALAMFHDENSDKQLNTGSFGIPLEGFGFSNNPRILFSAPSFSECSFAINDAKQTTIQIKVNHFL
ncbi:MAG: DUF2141 domain-containing protein [Silvanigrellaceae bacterium]